MHEVVDATQIPSGRASRGRLVANVAMLPGLLVGALLALTAVGCGDDSGESPGSQEMEPAIPKGACARRSGGDGPHICYDDWAETSCEDPEDLFYEGQSCTTAGYTFCCNSAGVHWKFRSQADAEAVTDGVASSCAENPRECEPSDLFD